MFMKLIPQLVKLTNNVYVTTKCPLYKVLKMQYMSQKFHNKSILFLSQSDTATSYLLRDMQLVHLDFESALYTTTLQHNSVALTVFWCNAVIYPCFRCLLDILEVNSTWLPFTVQ